MQPVPWSGTLRTLLLPLFVTAPPVPVRLWAILDGIMPGRILVDNPRHPTCVMIQEFAEGTTYWGGAASPDVLRAGVNLLRRERDVVICLWPDDPLASLLPPAPDYRGEAIDFAACNLGSDATARIVLPDGYSVRPLDRAIIPQLEGFGYYIDMFGSMARALDGTLGYCVLWQGNVVSEAVAGPFARGLAEIGVGTQAAYQGQGLATAAATHVIAACAQRGFQPFWNAAQQNGASVALARRLGFRHAATAQVYAWSRV